MAILSRRGSAYPCAMSEPITSLGAAVKLLAALIPEAVGSAIALRLNTIPLRPLDRMFSFACGVALAHYVGGGVSQYFALTGILEDASKVVVGIFGLNLSAAITAQIPTIIESARKRVLGDTK